MLTNSLILLMTLSVLARAASETCQIEYEGECFDNLSDAIQKSSISSTESDTTPHVVVHGNTTINVPIKFSHNLELVGGNNETRPVISVDFGTDGQGRGALELTGEHQNLTIANLSFVHVGSELGSAIRAPFPEKEDGERESNIGLNLSSSSFEFFKQNVYGSAIYLRTVSYLYVDNQTRLAGNDNTDQGEGGGSLYVDFVPAGVTVEVNGTFEDNVARSNHSQGAGLNIDRVQGAVHINGTFRNNVCVEGAAVFVREIFENATVTAAGFYEGNQAVRGALRITKTQGNVTVSGTFYNNTAYLGGAVRFNNIAPPGIVVLSGNFTHNKAQFVNLTDILFSVPEDAPDEYYGGVFFCWAMFSGVNLTGTFTKNTAKHQGGVVGSTFGVYNDGWLDMRKAKFSGNQALGKPNIYQMPVDGNPTYSSYGKVMIKCTEEMCQNQDMPGYPLKLY
eukprot:comp21676_c0_seq1/m.30522 comp21676_c0_seq1/g.30522  ORF comp21676_c0_seq1/g.30522 comp21676_c0_seq1/m.30522 type:complete len:450 (-) comp21676_c0_seq1:611-1960(-)